MKRLRTGLIIFVATIIGALTIAGCTSGKDEKSEGSKTSTESACTPKDGETTPKALLRCADRSVAFIENPYGTGTGVVVSHKSKTYVVTNLHVVDPFSSADVSINGSDKLGRLAVVGTDVAKDIALLGPVPEGADVTPLPLGNPKVEKGDDVYLVGFPGSADTENADLTITSGLASRTRKLDDWGQTYIQSDAVIGEGQSGGALFVSNGELAGISGLSYEDSFSLSLTISNVAEAVGRIVSGDGDDVISVPIDSDDDGASGSGAKEGVLRVPDDIETPTLFLPSSDEDREWNFGIAGPEGRFSVAAIDGLTGDPLFVNAAGVALTKEVLALQKERLGSSADGTGAGDSLSLPAEVVAREKSPGQFTVTIPAGVVVELVAGVASDAAPAELKWNSNLDLWALSEEIDTKTIEVDDLVTGLVSGYRLGVPFQVELEAGQKVTLSASSPQGDVMVIVSKPGRTITAFDLLGAEADSDVKLFDDSDKGLYGLDVLEKFTATEAGLYNVVLHNNDVVPMAYRLEVRTD